MHPQIATPFAPIDGQGQVITTVDGDSIASSQLAEHQAFQIWCADDFYLSVETALTPYTPATTTTARLKGNVVYTFVCGSTERYVHVARTAGANVSAYLWTIGV